VTKHVATKNYVNTLSLFTAVKLKQPIATKISNAIRNYQHIHYSSIQLEAVLACTTLTGCAMIRHIIICAVVHTQVVIRTLFM
jgi:hypothetical protein